MNKAIRKKIDNLWVDLASNAPEVLAPLYPDLHDRHKGGLVFVGMNPSFNEAALKQLFAKNSWPEAPRDYYLWQNKASQSDEKNRDIHVQNIEKYPFFKPHHELVKILGNPCWSHVDLFPYRMTSQKEFLKLLKNKPDFKNECLEIFSCLINEHMPKLIVIWNATAAHIFFEKYKYSVDNETGVRSVAIQGKETPVFASGMVTGRRSLDIYSRERMFWEIKRVFKTL